jgi:hypothetical protein
MGIRFKNNDDPVMIAVYSESRLEARMRGIAQGAGTEWPINLPERIYQFKSREKRKEIERWESLMSQGQLVKAFKESKIANACLSTQIYLSRANILQLLK